MVRYEVSQLSVSLENTIFHYLHLDVGEGVFLTPLSAPAGQHHSALLDNFYAGCGRDTLVRRQIAM